MSEIAWQFSEDLPERERRLSYLNKPPSFEQMTEEVSCSIRTGNPCVHVVRSQKTGTHVRFESCVEVGPKLFDLFWNSRNGYRAWYFLSVEIGENRNCAFMDVVRPTLIEIGTKSGLDPRIVQASLMGRSAKVWLAEVGKESASGCEICKGEWKGDMHAASPQILNHLWQGESFENRHGFTAYEFRKLRIFGAFVDAVGTEWDPKPDRSRLIHLNGWI